MSVPLFLIGSRGCGKTTVGRLLAERLAYDFTDTDRYLQSQQQQSIAEMVDKQGWSYFRQQEHQALLEVTEPRSVIATGGGIILRADNCQHMQRQGLVIWLDVDPEILARRLQADPEVEQRPTLTGKSITDEIAEVLQHRRPLYQQTAHYRLEAAQAPELLVAQILTLVDEAKTQRTTCLA